VTWGTNPEQAAPVTGRVPDPAQIDDPLKRAAVERALQYMQLRPNTLLTDVPVQRVFIGSCTNGRIEDLRADAEVARGRHVATGVNAIVVPGSGLVKEQAEDEGLDQIFLEAGFEWREPGCSMCLAMNADKLQPGERCASTSNRNFEGRQGRGGRTHLVSPAMAAAAAITGLTRCVRLSRPWRPSKLRLEVLALRSCGGRTSAFMPMHMLQPASRHSNPAWVKILSRPSFSAWALIPREPGTMSACLMFLATCFPATMWAAARRSSRRELVQEPMNTRSTGMSTIGVPGLRPIYFRALSVAF